MFLPLIQSSDAGNRSLNRLLQNREKSSATGKLIGQVAPTRTEHNSFIRQVS